MSAPDDRSRTVLVAAGCLLLAAVVAWGATREPQVPRTAGLPAPEEMDSLRRYLAPVADAPPAEDFGAYLPADSPREEGPVGAAPAAPAPELRLSAILISGETPLAIIDDRTVRRGERLAGGAEVVAIERDHVVVRHPDGTRRILRLTAGDEGDP